MKKLAGTFLVLGILAVACTQTKKTMDVALDTSSTTITSVTALSGKWILSDLKVGDSTITSSTDKTPFIEFSENEKKVAGFSGCNRFTGSYSEDHGKIKFSPLAGTKMMCENMKVEDALNYAMSNADDIHVDGEKLIFIKGDNTLATFIKSK